MIKIFTIPFSSEHETFFDDHINQFLLNKRVESIKAEFFEKKGHFYWSVFVAYDVVVDERKTKKKSKEKVNLRLNEKDALLFQRLKEWRKQRAIREGIPVYIIANNAELLSVVNVKPGSKEGMKLVKGYGKKKIEKYGDEILEIVSGFK